MKTFITSRLIPIGALAMALTVPAHALSLDLTAGGAGVVNGGYFTTTDNSSTGTGVIQSFVRVQDPNGPAEGYNADARPVMPDVNTSPTFTHDILLSEIPIVVNPDGASPGSYYEFLLDINQTNNSPLLSLDAIEIYTRSGPLAVANTYAALSGGATLRYSLDVGPDGNSELLLNYSLNSGSGSGDMFAYIPTAIFAGALGSDYLYFYSLFGTKGGDYAENDGFEEWAVRTSTPRDLPDAGSTILLLGSALAVFAAIQRRRQA